MAQTSRQIHRHGNSMTELAHWGQFSENGGGGRPSKCRTIYIDMILGEQTYSPKKYLHTKQCKWLQFLTSLPAISSWHNFMIPVPEISSKHQFLTSVPYFIFLHQFLSAVPDITSCIPFLPSVSDITSWHHFLTSVSDISFWHQLLSSVLSGLPDLPASQYSSVAGLQLQEKCQAARDD